MPDTSNEQIRDALIRRQTQLIRGSVSLGRDMRRLLSNVDNDLRTVIERRLENLTAARPKFGKTRTQRLQALQEAIQNLQRPTWIEIRRQMKQQMVETGNLEAQFLKGTIEGSLPVVVDLALPSSALMRAIATSQPFQGKVMSKHLAKLQSTDTIRMMDAIRVGMVEGEGSAEIGRRVFGTAQRAFSDGVRELTKQQVTTISRTAINHIGSQARAELSLANKELFTQDLYVATLDGDTTPQCQSLDGQLFDIGKGPFPPLHFNCRSLRVPAVNGRVAGQRPAKAVTRQMLEGHTRKEKRGIINSLTGTVPASQSYTKFLRNQTVDFQNDVLGKTKATLFRKGDVTLQQFVTPQGKPLTLKQLRVSEPQAFIKAGLQKK